MKDKTGRGREREGGWLLGHLSDLSPAAAAWRRGSLSQGKEEAASLNILPPQPLSLRPLQSKFPVES